MKNLENPPAFPSNGTIILDKNTGAYTHYGMTLLDYFAAMAMSSLASIYESNRERDELPQRSYDIAEAMLEERQKRLNNE